MENNLEKNQSEVITKNCDVKEVDKLKKQVKIKLSNKITDKSLKEIDILLKKINDIEPIKPSVSAEDAWSDFRKNYLPRVVADKKTSVKKIRYKFSIVVAVIIVFVSVNIISVAAGLDIFKPFLKWTSEVLNLKADDEYIISNNDISVFNNIKDLEKTLNENIPEPDLSFLGFEIFNISIGDDGTVNIDYANEEDSIIKYKIFEYNNDLNTFIEKTEDETFEIYYNDISYCYIKNNRWSVIEWDYNNKVYYISGDFSKNEAKEIVENIKY